MRYVIEELDMGSELLYFGLTHVIKDTQNEDEVCLCWGLRDAEKVAKALNILAEHNYSPG